MDINKYLEEFNREEECLYKRELYSVRDNGGHCIKFCVNEKL